MPAHDPFQKLVHELGRWREALEALHCTVTEDRPAANDVALADYYENAVTDALGWLAEALQAAERAAEMAGGGESFRNVGRGLALVHARINDLARQHLVEIAGWERVSDLTELGRRRGRQWQRWAEAVRRSLESVPEAQHAAQSALAEAWQAMQFSTAPSGALMQHAN